MRFVRDGIAYDTEKATELVGGNSPWSGAWWALYRTPTGAFFKMVVDHDGETFLECGTLTEAEARSCVEEKENHLVEKYFGLMPEPGSPQLQRPAVTVALGWLAQDARATELVTLKPAIWGMSIDLKELYRRARLWL
jgi:hypothetical protein